MIPRWPIIGQKPCLAIVGYREALRLPSVQRFCELAGLAPLLLVQRYFWNPVLPQSCSRLWCLRRPAHSSDASRSLDLRASLFQIPRADGDGNPEPVEPLHELETRNAESLGHLAEADLFIEIPA